MNREFTIAIGWKIFYGLIAIGMVVFAIFLFGVSKTSNTSNALLLLPVAVLVGGILLLIKLFKSKIVVDDDSIASVGVFKKNQIATADIKGIRISDKAIVVEADNGSGKVTFQNYTDYSGSDELKDWLRSKFTDLDAVEAEQELNTILSDTSLGFTEEDRKAALRKAKTVSVAYSIGGAVVAVCGFFWSSAACTILMMIYPLLGIPIIMSSKGLIKLITKKTSPYYHIFIGVEFPAIMLMVKGIADGHVLQFDNLWLPIIVLAAIFIGGYSLVSRNNNTTTIRGQVFLLSIFGIVYSVGGVLQTNMLFDVSAEKVYQTTVIDHHITHGKSTSYYITLSPWGPETQSDEISVSSYRYNHSDIGSTVAVHLKKGYLNIPWYTVSGE